MLHISVNGDDFFNETTQEFITIKPQHLVMEHSLLSLSKWEANWKKPFLTDEKKTPDEYLDYIKCMTITPKVDDLLYKCLSGENFDAIYNYINDPRTATTINRVSNRNRSFRRSRVVTSELIYYWMIANNIPIECEKWHLNRLMILIEICSIENNPKKKKMSRNAILQQNRELNAARRAKYHTKG